MPKFLSLYLVVTGGLALLALAAPWLVVAGLFLGLVPGIMLGLAPTAFFWGCVFTGSWFATRTVLGDGMLSFIVAGIVTAALLVAATQPNRAASRAAYEASLLPDITPPGRLRMAGDVRIDVPRPRWDNENNRGQGGLRGFACDNLCVALLFTPGVTSVTVNSLKAVSDEDHRNGGGGFDPEARTYRLVPKPDCPGGLKPSLSSRSGLYPADPKAGAALTAEWNLRFAEDVCLTRSDPIGRHDILIRHGRYGAPAYLHQRWRLAPRAPSLEYIDIRTGQGKVLLRRFKSSIRMLGPLLYIIGEGDMQNFAFGWGTSVITNKRQWDAIDLLRELEAHTNTIGRFGGADMLPAMRKQLNAALTNPHLGPDAPAFQLLPAYFEALPDELSDEDLAIVTGLARDQRIADYEGIWEMTKLPLDQQVAIRSALVERALLADEPIRLQRSRAPLFIERMPQGSFAPLTTSEERLLTLVDKRPALPSLVARLDEAPGDRVPLLLSIIREHSLRHRRYNEAQKGSENSQKIDAERSMVMAARTALCRMGPRAGTALAPLRKMVADGIIYEAKYSGSRGEKWDLMMVRIGLPLWELKKREGQGGTDDSYRERIRRNLERFDPDQDC